MRRYVHDAAVLARKDVQLELRGRETLPAMVLFVLGALVVFHFAVPTGDSKEVGTGLLWVVILFTALLALVRAFVAEREQRLMDGLLLAPCDRSAIWLGKALAVFLFLVLTEAVALPVFELFFSSIGWSTVVAVVLADVGIVAVGTLLSAMASVTRSRELLMPLLFLPLAIPIVIGGVGASISEDPGRYLAFLVLYDAVFAIISWASFEYVVSE